MNSLKSLLFLPLYFFKGLVLFSKSYKIVIESWKKNEKAYQNHKAYKNSSVETLFIINNRNEALRLIQEHEKMFGQLFAVFISTLSLGISFLVLIFKK